MSEVHALHGEIEPDGSLTLRMVGDSGYTIWRRVPAFSVGIEVVPTGAKLHLHVEVKQEPTHELKEET